MFNILSRRQPLCGLAVPSDLNVSIAPRGGDGMLLTGAAMRYQPVCHLAVCPPLPQPEKMWERAGGLDRHLTKDDIRVTNKHTERFSASLFITKPKFKLPGVTTTAGYGKGWDGCGWTCRSSHLLGEPGRASGVWSPTGRSHSAPQ